MALTNPTQASTVIANSAVAGTDTFSLTMTAGLVYVLLCTGNQANKTISACSDSLSNTWTQVKIQSQTSASTSTWVTTCTTGGSATVSTTFTTSVSSNVWYLAYSSSQLTGSADKAISGASSVLPGTTTNCEPSTGTGTLSSADQICFEAMGFSGAPGTWTKRGNFTDTLAATGYRFGWQVVSATTAVTGGGTYTTARNNSICLTTFPGSASSNVAITPASFTTASVVSGAVIKLWKIVASAFTTASVVSGAVSKLPKPIVPASFITASAVSGSVRALKLVKPASFTTASVVSGALTKGPKLIVPASFTTASAVSGSVAKLARITPASFTTASAVSGGITKQAKLIVPVSFITTSTVSGSVAKIAKIAGSFTTPSAVSATLVRAKVFTSSFITNSAVSGRVNKLAKVAGTFTTPSVVGGHLAFTWVQNVEVSADTADSDKSVTFTPNVGELYLVYAFITGNTSAPTISDTNPDGLSSYDLIDSRVKVGTTDKMWVYARHSLIGSASSNTVTLTRAGTITGGSIMVVRVRGIGRAGTLAVRQFGGENNQSSSNPGPTLGLSPLARDTLVYALFNATNPPSISGGYPDGWKVWAESGYLSPFTGVGIAAYDGGLTSTPIFGTTSGSAYCDSLIELDSSPQKLIVPASFTTPSAVSGSVAGRKNLVVASITTASVVSATVSAQKRVTTANIVTPSAVSGTIRRNPGITPAAIVTPSVVGGYLAYAYVFDVIGSADTNDSNKTVTFTPAAGELYVVFAFTSGNVTDPTIGDTNADGLSAYTNITSRNKGTNTDRISAWVRTSRIGSATSNDVTMTKPGTITGGAIIVVRIRGGGKAGTIAIRQSSGESNQGASNPAPAYGAAPLARDLQLFAVFNGDNPPASNLIPPGTGWTPRLQIGYPSPTSGAAVASLDAGLTTTTLTFSQTSGSPYADIIVEVDSGPARLILPAAFTTPSSVSGGLVGNKLIVPASFTTPSTVSAAVRRLRPITPAAFTTSSAVAVTKIITRIIPSNIVTPSAVSGVFTRLGNKALIPAAFTTASVVGAVVGGKRTYHVATTATTNTVDTDIQNTTTPAVGDLILLTVTQTGQTTTAPTVSDNNADGLGAGYTFVTSRVKAGTTDKIWTFVRNALIGSATSTDFFMVRGASGTGEMIAVTRLARFTKVGANAIRQTGGENNQSSSNPAPTYGVAPLSTNTQFYALYNATNPPNLGIAIIPQGWTEQLNTGYASPAVGLEIATLDSGQVTRPPLDVTSGSPYADIIIEFDSSPLKLVSGTFTTPSSVSGSVKKIAQVTPAAIVTNSAVSGYIAINKKLLGASFTTPSTVYGIGPIPSWVEGLDGDITIVGRPPGFEFTPGSAAGGHDDTVYIIMDGSDHASSYGGSPLAYEYNFNITGATPTSSDPWGGKVSPFNHHFYLPSRPQGKVNEYLPDGTGVKQIGHGSNIGGATHISGGSQNEVSGWHTSHVTTAFTQPASGSNVTVEVDDTSWMVANNLILFIAGGGFYRVQSIVDSTHISVKNAGYIDSATAGATVPSGGTIVPGGIASATGLLIQGSNGDLTIGDTQVLGNTGRITKWSAAGAFLGQGILSARDEKYAMGDDGRVFVAGTIFDNTGAFLATMFDANGSTLPGTIHHYIPPKDANSHVFSSYWPNAATPVVVIHKHKQDGTYLATFYIRVNVVGTDGHLINDYSYDSPGNFVAPSFDPYFITTGDENYIYFMPGDKNFIYKYPLVPAGSIFALRKIAGSFTTASAVSGTLNKLAKISGTVVTASAVTGSVKALKFIRTSSFVTASAVAGLVTLPGTIRAIAGSFTTPSVVSGSLRVLRAIKPASFTTASAVSGTVTALKRITPASFTTASVVSGSVAKQFKFVAAPITTPSVVSATVSKRAAIKPASFITVSVVNATVSAGKLIVPASFTTASVVSGNVVSLRRIVTANIVTASTVSGSVSAKRPIVASAFTTSSLVALSVVGAIRRIQTAAFTTTSVVSGVLSKVGTAQIVPASFVTTSTVSGAIIARKAIKPTAIVTPSAVSATVIDLLPLLPTPFSTNSTVSATVRVARTVPTALIVTPSALSGVVSKAARISGTLSTPSILSGAVNVRARIKGATAVTPSSAFATFTKTRIDVTVTSSTLSGGYITSRNIRTGSIGDVKTGTIVGGIS